MKRKTNVPTHGCMRCKNCDLGHCPICYECPNSKRPPLFRATPPLRGRDAKEFLERMDRATMIPERLAYLREAVEESRRACRSLKC